MMITKDYLLHKLKELKMEYMAPILAASTKPKGKFLRQTLPAVDCNKLPAKNL